MTPQQQEEYVERVKEFSKQIHTEIALLFGPDGPTAIDAAAAIEGLTRNLSVLVCTVAGRSVEARTELIDSLAETLSKESAELSALYEKYVDAKQKPSSLH